MDVCYTDARNKVYLLRFTERILQQVGLAQNYQTMPKVDELVTKCAGDLLEINKFFDTISIEFAEWAVNQSWNKISASLGVDENGNNIAKSTKELFSEFKDQRGIDPDIN